MAKKRIFAFVFALFLILSCCGIVTANKGPVLEDGDSISKTGDYYIMEDGKIRINQIATKTIIKIRKAKDNSVGMEEDDLDFLVADTCVFVQTGSSLFGGAIGYWKCEDCEGNSPEYNSNRYQFRACIGTSWHEVQSNNKYNGDPVEIPVKAGDVLKVFKLNADHSNIEYIRIGDEVPKQVFCINEEGEVGGPSQTPIPISITSSRVLTLDTPIRNTLLVYLTGIKNGAGANKQMTVYKGTYFNGDTTSKVNYGVGNLASTDYASWNCDAANNDANKCISIGSFEPKVIKILIPGKWDTEIGPTFEKISLNAGPSGNSEFQLCALTGCDFQAAEKCNGKDNNCNGNIDEGCDSDQDGYIDADMNCDGTPVCTAEDGTVSDSCNGCDKLDCDDNDADVNPGAAELCVGDGDTLNTDDNCNGEINEDCGGQSFEDCEAVGATWVGYPDSGSCCNDTRPEYYNYWNKSLEYDLISVCWNESGVANLETVDSQDKILHYNGTLYGCDITDPDYGDGHYDEDIQSNSNSCHNVGDDELGYYYCDLNWTFFHGMKSDLLKLDPEEDSDGCCPEDYCWNFTECISGSNIASSGADYISGNVAKRCSAGKWVDLEEKPDQNGNIDDSILCGEDECHLFDELTNSHICVNDGYFEFDDYCYKGSWTTRTALIALQLVNITGASNEYTVYCDNFESAINDNQYILKNAVENASPFIIGYAESLVLAPTCFECPYEECPCVNNFCVLRFKDVDGQEKVAFGVSANLEINASSSNSFLNIFAESQEAQTIDYPIHNFFCDSVIESGSSDYMGCDRNDAPIQGSEANIWYNPKTESIIYSPEGIVVGKASFSTDVIRFIRNPINSIISLFGSQDDDSIELVDSNRFDKLYLNRKGPKAIRGFVNKFEPRMSISYDNINTDICKYTETLSKKACLLNSDCIECKIGFSQEGPSFLVYSDDQILIRSNSYWPDLTGKIRLDDSDVQTREVDSPLVENVLHSEDEWTGEMGFPMKFIVTLAPGIDESDIAAVFWDFGDGTTLSTSSFSEANEIQNLYTAPGSYDYILTVFNKDLEYQRYDDSVNVEAFANDHGCNLDDQCQSSFCTGSAEEIGVCKDSSCSDGMLGPEEADVDCGGICLNENPPKTCLPGKKCKGNEDCNTDQCLGTQGVCVIPQIECAVRSSCESDEVSLMSMTSTANAHAGIPGQGPLEVCCMSDHDDISDDCLGLHSEDLIRLSSESNAHASTVTDVNYPIELCINADNNNIKCEVSESCESSCLFSVSGETNAHVGDCNAYSSKVCCGFEFLAECGNGECDEDETCNNCLQDCHDCCGDGFCDESNEDCTTCETDCGTCPVCGDGTLDAGEECDDGNLDDNDGCNSTCQIEKKIIFVTSSQMQGDFGGLEEADAQCQDEADAAGLIGTYKAWLSDSTTSAAMRLNHPTSAIIRTFDNEVVADDWNDFVDGEFKKAIRFAADGTQIDMGRHVWTGSNIDGSSAYKNCINWNSEYSEGVFTTITNSMKTYHKWCNDRARFFCLEQ